jgi:hypothetical protein
VPPVPHQQKTIPVGQLLLDTENPRHEPVQSQREAISALIVGERQKLVVLANDIVENGLSPIDRLLVVKKGRNYTVVEGNRRLAALRLLDNPSLADGSVIENAIARVARDAEVPVEVDCAVVGSRADAEHWMVLRHTGEAEGAGVVRWNGLATNRFRHKPGSQAAKAIAFLQALEDGFPNNEVIQELSEGVAAKRLTTLGRLVADPTFKVRVGLVEQDGTVLFHFPATALQEFLEHVLGDIAADVSVSQLKSKSQRTEYLAKTPEPDPSQRTATPHALSDAPSNKPAKKPQAKPKSSKPARPFKDLDLSQLGAKTQAILREYRRIDVDKMPNTAGVMTRAILELAVDDFIAKKGLTSDPKLRKRVAACLKVVDPSQKALEYQSLRAGLQDGTSLYAVATLHGFVHNPHYHADGTTVRNIAANIGPFLQAMNQLV